MTPMKFVTKQNSSLDTRHRLPAAIETVESTEHRNFRNNTGVEKSDDPLLPRPLLPPGSCPHRALRRTRSQRAPYLPRGPFSSMDCSSGRTSPAALKGGPAQALALPFPQCLIRSRRSSGSSRASRVPAAVRGAYPDADYEEEEFLAADGSRYTPIRQIQATMKWSGGRCRC